MNRRLVWVLVLFVFGLFLVFGAITKELGPTGARQIAIAAAGSRVQMQAIDDSRWFGGETIVSANLSEAVPLKPPCPKPTTADFEQAFRSRQCSVIVYAEDDDKYLFWGWQQAVGARLVSENVFSGVADIHANFGDRYFLTRGRSFTPPLPANSTPQNVPTHAAGGERTGASKCVRTGYTSVDFLGSGTRFLVDALACPDGNIVVITGTGETGSEVRCTLDHYGTWTLQQLKVDSHQRGEPETLEIKYSQGANTSTDFVRWSGGRLERYDFERSGSLPVLCR